MRIQETDLRHSQMIDAFAYRIAAQEAKTLDEWILPYVKKKPWYIPHFIYGWVIEKVFVLAKFKK